jgi:1,2-diacylglycerol 3-alpha-glucosyltransferase
VAPDPNVLALDAAAEAGEQLSTSSPTRVLFSCTGVGIFNRGIESFFREAFDGLKNCHGIDAVLLKGGGTESESERIAACLPRTGAAAVALGKILRRNSYVAEQLSSLPSAIREIRTFKPQVVFYSDANLGFQLYRWRDRIGVPFRLLFSNGGPCRPPFDRTDFVHQVAPFYREVALEAGESETKHHMVPYGVHVTAAPELRMQERAQLRVRLGIPVNRKVVLSVGWISREHKRMHYLVDELARLPEPRPYLQMLGAMDASSTDVVRLATRRLGADGFSARSVEYKDVADYYRAADLFVLASLREGFGRVYLEAMMHGLPVIAHDHPVMEFVTGGLATLRDLSREGALAASLAETLQAPCSDALMKDRWRSVRDRFSWNVLAPRYIDMFRVVGASV